MLLEGLDKILKNYSQKHFKTIVYLEFGGQTKCIMGDRNGQKNCSFREFF